MAFKKAALFFNTTYCTGNNIVFAESSHWTDTDNRLHGFFEIIAVIGLYMLPVRPCIRRNERAKNMIVIFVSILTLVFILFSSFEVFSQYMEMAIA